MFSFFACLTLTAICLFLFGLNLDLFWLRLPCKPIPHLFLLYWILKFNTGTYSKRIALGLVFCMVGDFLLEFRQTMFIWGLVFFLAGHFTYITAFLNRNKKLMLPHAIPFLIWGIIVFSIIQGDLGQMTIPVSLYTAIICIMMWRASCLIDTEKYHYLSYAALVGSVLFCYGDTLIAVDRFYRPIEHVRFPIILTYWLAQGLIVLSIKDKKTSYYLIRCNEVTN